MTFAERVRAAREAVGSQETARVSCSVCEAHRLIPVNGPAGACEVCGYAGYEDVDP